VVMLEAFTATVSPKKKVMKISIRLCMEDATGVINVTDIAFQSGMLATLWNAHPAELRFSFE